MAWHPRSKRILWAGAGLLVLALLWVGVAVLSIPGATGEFLYDAVGALPKQRVGLVLGCADRLADGRRNLFFLYRVQAAAALFKAGKVEYLLLSGDNSRPDYDEPARLREALLAEGVPLARLVLDYAGFRTLDSVVRAREVFGLQEFTIISQRFHNERAVYLARQAGIRAIAFNARAVDGVGGLKTRIREVGARVLAILDVLWGTQPKFVGPPVRIGERT